jgi:hypothetical protein
MGTEVGGVVVSTVGDYHPLPFEHDEPAEVGFGRKFETFVFRASGKHLDCGCPEIEDWTEIDSDGYNDAVSAQAGHMAMVEKWAAKGDV